MGLRGGKEALLEEGGGRDRLLEVGGGCPLAEEETEAA